MKRQLMTKLKGAACAALTLGLAFAAHAVTCCKIGDTPYETITAALATVTDDTATTITLAANVTEDVTIAASRTITLDLNGFVLKGSGSATVVNNPNGSKLTIADTCSPRPRHYFTEGSNNLWVWNNDAQETAFYVDGGLVTGGKGTNGGGVYSKGGTVTFTNVTLVGNQATSRGGSFRVESSCTVNAASSAFLHNYAATYGGAFEIQKSTVSLTDCRIIGNKSPDRGGASYVYNSTMTLRRCVVSENIGKTGGGFDSWNTTFSVYDSEFTNNQATSDGGAVRSYWSSGYALKFSASNTVFRGNSAGNDGGGFLTPNDAPAAFTNCVFKGNTSTGSGAALYSTKSLTLTDCIVTGNTAGKCGVVRAVGMPTVTGNTSVTNNTGGNVYLDSGKTITVNDGFSGMIGVTTQTAPTTDAPVALTGTCAADQHARFVSDNADYYVANAADNVATLCLRLQITVIAPTAPEHVTVAVYTNGVQLTEEGPWTIGNDVAVTAVYTAAKGYIFKDLSSAWTNAFDMTQNPATVAVPTAIPFSSDEAFQVGDAAWACIDNDGVCTIMGTGSISIEYPELGNRWANVKDVWILNGITTVGDYAFYKFYNLTNVTLAASCTLLCDGAFFRCLSLEQVTIEGDVPNMLENALNVHAGIRMEDDQLVVYAVPNVTVNGKD